MNKTIENLVKQLNKLELQLRVNQKQIAAKIAAIFEVAKADKIEAKKVIKYLEDNSGMKETQIKKYKKVGEKNIGLLDTMNIEAAYNTLQGKKERTKLSEIDKIGRIITSLLNKVQSNNLEVSVKLELAKKIKEVLSMLKPKIVKIVKKAA